MSPETSHFSHQKGWPRRRLVIDILTAFISLLVITVLVIVSYTYHNNSQAILKISDRFLTQVSENVIEKTTNYLRPVVVMTEFSSHIVQQGTLSFDETADLTYYGIEFLKAYPQVAMFNLGDEQGNFLMQKRMPDGTIATKIIDRTVEPPLSVWYYRNAAGEVIQADTLQAVDFDPRVRPWYRGAKEKQDRYWQDLYIFFTDRTPGISAAYPLFSEQDSLWGVLGADIELSQVSQFLESLTIGESGQVLIINPHDEVVAHPRLMDFIEQQGDNVRPVSIRELNQPALTQTIAHAEQRGESKIAVVVDGTRYLGSVTPFPADFGKDWRIVVVVPENDFIGVIKQTNRVAVVMALAVLLVAVLIAIKISRNISRPIVTLTRETRRIKDFELEGHFQIRSTIYEIQLMSESIQKMKNGLKAFRKYVPAGLVRELIDSGEEARLGGQNRNMTILFSDIVSFTSLSEGVNPKDIMVHLSEYFEELATIIRDQNGTIDKFIGDSVMAFWGAPLPNENHPRDACRAALQMQYKLQELNQRWEQDGRLTFPTRIGIHTGETVVGNMGASERMNYTVIGDTVNLASRLEGVNKVYGTRILISEVTREQVKDDFIMRPLGRVAVKGKQKGVMIYELLAEAGEVVPESTLELCKVFEQGLQAYFVRDWERAVGIFDDIVERFPDDQPARLYAGYCRTLREEQPDASWDGVIRLKSK